MMLSLSVKGGKGEGVVVGMDICCRRLVIVMAPPLCLSCSSPYYLHSPYFTIALSPSSQNDTSRLTARKAVDVVAGTEVAPEDTKPKPAVAEDTLAALSFHSHSHFRSRNSEAALVEIVVVALERVVAIVGVVEIVEAVAVVVIVVVVGVGEFGIAVVGIE